MLSNITSSLPVNCRMTRTVWISQKARTPFGPMYVHLDVDPYRRPSAGSTSSPGKGPDSTVEQTIDSLSAGLEGALKAVGRPE